MPKRAIAPWRRLACELRDSGHRGDQHGRSDIGSRNEPFLLVGQDCKTGNAIVLMMWAELSRMDNGERLPGQN